MQSKELATSIQKFQQEGGNWTALRDQLDALFAEDKSTLGLKVWRSADKPRMEDFNENYQRLEEEILALRAELANKANTTHPQVYDLEYEEPHETYHRSWFSKDIFGMVRMYVSVKLIEPGTYFENGKIIACLPESCWPSQTYEWGGTCHDNTGFVPATLILGTDGKIKIASRTTTGRFLHIAPISFPAAQ